MAVTVLLSLPVFAELKTFRSSMRMFFLSLSHSLLQHHLVTGKKQGMLCTYREHSIVWINDRRLVMLAITPSGRS